jgi:hypothetical protein
MDCPEYDYIMEVHSTYSDTIYENDLRQRLLYFPPFQHPWTLLLLRYHSCCATVTDRFTQDNSKTSTRQGTRGTTAMATMEFQYHFQSTNRSSWSVLPTILKEQGPSHGTGGYRRDRKHSELTV